MDALVNDHDPAPYIKYWERRMNQFGNVEQAAQHVAYILTLVDALIAKPETIPAPIVNVTPKGRYQPWDGSHRACILRALGRPVPFTVTQ